MIEVFLDENEDNEQKYMVYMHQIDTESGPKVYIGATKDLKWRWGIQGRGYKTHKRFWADITKYGYKNVRHFILEKGLTYDEANARECYWIAYYDSTNPEKGYNMSKGGWGGIMVDTDFTTLKENPVIVNAHTGLITRLGLVYPKDSEQYLEFMSEKQVTSNKTGYVLYRSATSEEERAYIINQGPINPQTSKISPRTNEGI